MDGADTFVFDTAVNEELLILKGLDTILDLNFFGIALHLVGNLSSLEKIRVRYCKKRYKSETLQRVDRLLMFAIMHRYEKPRIRLEFA
jgi:hypothetical protein